MCSYGQPRYRGKQLFDGLYKHGRHSLSDIVQVPKAFREQLTAAGVTVGRSELHQLVEAKDGTVKMLLRLADGLVVETVGIPADRASTPRLTVCVSSQVIIPAGPPHVRCLGSRSSKGT